MSPTCGALEVTYATTSACVEAWVAQHGVAADVLGFDTETKPAFHKGTPPRPPATLQLSTPSACLVVQLTTLDRIPAALHDLLADPHTLKVRARLFSSAVVAN